MKELTAKIYNQTGQEVGVEKLPAVLFGVKIKSEVVQLEVVAQQANARVAIADTKGRGEVRGGGRKPWKQKGTGRARHGSIRSPLWVGGGITFGPTSERNFDRRINKKVRKKALAMVLSDKVANDKLLLLDSVDLAEAKTKMLHQLLIKLPSKGKKTMIVTDAGFEKMIRAAKNLARSRTISVKSLNVVDVLDNDFIILPKQLLASMIKIYS